MPIRGKSLLSIRIGSYMDKIPTYAVDTLIKGVDVILGRDWLLANRVIINYAKMTCTIRSHGSSKHSIHPLSRGHNDPKPATKDILACLKTQASDGSKEVSSDLISARKAMKALLKGADYLLVLFIIIIYNLY